MTPGVDCRCSPCQGLRAEYGTDAALLGLYARKLLKRGWAGRTTDVEREYQRAHSTWFAADSERGKRLAANRPGTGARQWGEAETSEDVPNFIAPQSGARKVA